MTPSRAVLIFKTEEHEPTGHELKREALPWWIFGVVGGLAGDVLRAGIPGRAVWSAALRLGASGVAGGLRLDVRGGSPRAISPAARSWAERSAC